MGASLVLMVKETIVSSLQEHGIYTEYHGIKNGIMLFRCSKTVGDQRVGQDFTVNARLLKQFRASVLALHIAEQVLAIKKLFDDFEAA